MSRVGRKQITIPQGVKVEYSNSIVGEVGNFYVSVSGPKGVLVQEIKAPIYIVVDKDNEVQVRRHDDLAQSRALHGLYNRLITNMIEGVTKGFTKTLILNGVGYKATMKGENLVLALGYSHPIEVPAEEGIKFKICTPAEVQAMNLGKDGIGVVLQVSGADKEKVGAVASKIRDLRVVEPYHLYGVRYAGEYVVRKESKSGKKK